MDHYKTINVYINAIKHINSNEDINEYIKNNSIYFPKNKIK